MFGKKSSVADKGPIRYIFFTTALLIAEENLIGSFSGETIILSIHRSQSKALEKLPHPLFHASSWIMNLKWITSMKTSLRFILYFVIVQYKNCKKFNISASNLNKILLICLVEFFLIAEPNLLIHLNEFIMKANTFLRLSIKILGCMKDR